LSGRKRSAQRAAGERSQTEVDVKKIEAIIQPSRLERIRDRLAGLGVSGMTVSDVRGFGRQKGRTELYRGAEYEVSLLPKVKIEIVLEDIRVPMLIEEIVRATRSGRIGDGKIFVLPVEDAVRIRTGDRGAEAI
jgi:nitrogen regulatory protein P-II 1